MRSIYLFIRSILKKKPKTIRMRINWFKGDPEIREVDPDVSVHDQVCNIVREHDTFDFWVEYEHEEKGWISGGHYESLLKEKQL